MLGGHAVCLRHRQITNTAPKLTKLSTVRSSSHGTLKHLDLFAGCGGFTLAAEQTRGKIQTTQFVEIDPDCHAILQHHWPQGENKTSMALTGSTPPAISRPG
nr:MULTISPECIES: DNA cytosine methyltransferase [unclassified Synechocystis]